MDCFVYLGNRMTQPFSASFTNFKPVTSRKTVQLIFEAPIENMIPILQYLGNPTDTGAGLVAIARIDSKAVSSNVEAKPSDTTESYAKKLYQSYFMRNERVCRALGDDDDFLDYIRDLPSAFDGNTENIEPSHVRRVKFGAGTGRKPPYCAIPLTHDQHKLTHDKGESALAEPEWFEKKAMEYRERWVKLRMKQLFNVGSLADISKEYIEIWARNEGIEDLLP